MSSGGVFQIIANEGRTDRLLLATALLNQRIKDIQCARSQAGKADCWPTLVDIERTHVLFTNAHFKPYVAMAYEYRKVKVQNGTPAFDTTITFSIPQIGDFFYDMAFRVSISEATARAQNTPAQVDDATAPVIGQRRPPFARNTVNGVAGGTSTFYRLVDYAGSVVATGGSGGAAGNLTVAGADRPLNAGAPRQVTYSNLVHLCEYPGNRFFKEVKFEVNETVLDKYDDTCSMMFQKFCIPPNKKTGYDRMHGQEVPVDCWSAPLPSRHMVYNEANQDTPTLTNPDTVPTIHSGLNGTGVDYVGYGNSARYLKKVVSGPQTPMRRQPELELIHKLQFWFNNDVRLAVPSVSIPYGQRFITAVIAPRNRIYYEYPGIAVEQTTTTTNAPAPNQFNLGSTTVKYFPYFQTAGTDPFNSLTIRDIELYINNIFVNPEVHDIYIRRIGFSLIRVHLYTSITTNDETSGERILNQLKWPVEYIMFGIRPKFNVDSNNMYEWRDWHRLNKINTGYFHEVPNSKVRSVNNVATAGGGTIGTISDFSMESFAADRYVTEVKTVDKIKVSAHGITLYDEFDSTFHNLYLPYHYGGQNLNTPEDTGVYMINFCLYPGTYQPSGHINISRAREFSLQWKTSYINNTRAGDLLVVASAINFLLISDGSAVLRFST